MKLCSDVDLYAYSISCNILDHNTKFTRQQQ